jgi:hypothetical protein
VQLFRTKSLDSLVRYFASYLPSDHPWYKSADLTSGSDADSSVDSVTDSHPSLFDDDCPLMTDEPFDFSTSLDHLLPASPRSMTMCSDSSVASPIDDIHHDYDLPPLTPARTLSFSGSESESELDCCDMSETHTHCGERLLTTLTFCSSLDSNASIFGVQVCLFQQSFMVLTTKSSQPPMAKPTPKREFSLFQVPIPQSRRCRHLNPRVSRHPSSKTHQRHYPTTDDTEVSRRHARNPSRSATWTRCSSPIAIHATSSVQGSGRRGSAARCHGGGGVLWSQRRGYRSHCQSRRGRGPGGGDWSSSSICFGVLAFRRFGGWAYRYPLYKCPMIVHTCFVFMTVMSVLTPGLWIIGVVDVASATLYLVMW